MSYSSNFSNVSMWIQFIEFLENIQ